MILVKIRIASASAYSPRDLHVRQAKPIAGNPDCQVKWLEVTAAALLKKAGGFIADHCYRLQTAKASLLPRSSRRGKQVEGMPSGKALRQMSLGRLGMAGQGAGCRDIRAGWPEVTVSELSLHGKAARIHAAKSRLTKYRQ